ncbi:MAG: hypothetical protein ABSH56_02320 [Bryobacteraceae bacterium]|jgi:predicted nucleic acid-binding protein
MKAIADTGFLVAFGNRNDYHHEWAAAIAERVTEPLLTCEAVLAETAFHLGSSALVLALLGDGLVRSALVLSEHISRLEELAARHADCKPDLADLCLIRLKVRLPNGRSQSIAFFPGASDPEFGANGLLLSMDESVGMSVVLGFLCVHRR